MINEGPIAQPGQSDRLRLKLKKTPKDLGSNPSRLNFISFKNKLNQIFHMEEPFIFPKLATSSFNLKEQLIDTSRTLCEQFESDKPNIEAIVRQLANLRNKLNSVINNGAYSSQIEAIDYFIRRFQENPTPAVYLVASRFISQELSNSVFNKD